MLDKTSLSERDICTKFITPAIVKGIFGGKDKYLEAVKELEKELYKAA